ncbi:hypothetical protein AAE478_007662 [Parahypoxylon ruwenzoriense]
MDPDPKSEPSSKTTTSTTTATTTTTTPEAASFSNYKPPSSILIIGAGVFGLSTALALTKRAEFASSTITILDRSPEPGVFPARDASSIDSSRIIRSDYADLAYAALAAEAQAHWRQHLTHPRTTNPKDAFGGEGRYAESGFVLAGDAGPLTREDGSCTGIAYAKKSWVNALALAQAEGRSLSSIHMLAAPKTIAMVSGTRGEFADWGYLNDVAGWADAEASMRFMYERVAATGRVTFINGTAESLLTTETSNSAGSNSNQPTEPPTVTGARLKEDGRTLTADLVIVAAGAWTPKLVDLSSQAVATGQVLGYIDITEEEQRKLEKIPILLNVSTGFFVIPPRNRVLKVARHSYGYLNPQPLTTPPLGAPGNSSSKNPAPSPSKLVSQPHTHLSDPDLAIPLEGEASLRAGLRRTIPWPELYDRAFARTRLCWYTDTATGDFIVDYHPQWRGLFVATGGSGHAFKFLPVIGDKVVECIMDKCPPEFRDKWRWKAAENGDKADGEKIIATEDGSRGGQPGLILEEEFKRNTE